MRRTKLYILLIITLFALGGTAFLVARNAAHVERISKGKPRTASVHRDTTSSSRNYKELLARLEAKRLGLASRYQQASSAERAALMAEARIVITQAIYDEIFPAWYGTAWDFNGTSEIPQQGKIACGYFVTTVLRDAGLKVQRVRLAQQASEHIILSLTTEPLVKRFRRVAIGDFVNAVKEWGPGIYIVGLDVHVGFVVNTGDEVYFIHSSYVDPFMVVSERAIESPVLIASKYRVLGKVFADDRLISDWLLGKPINLYR
jgi:hypothetical protein